MLRQTVFIVMAFALMACGSTVVGQEGAGAPPPGGFARPGMGGMTPCPATALAPPPAGFVDRAEPLQLTDDQKTKLKDILAKGEETLMPLRQKAGEASRTLRQALFAPEFDAQKVAQLAAEAEKAETAIIKAEIDVWAKIRGVLTADQVTKLQDMMGRMGGGRRGRRGGGAPPPTVQ